MMTDLTKLFIFLALFGPLTIAKDECITDFPVTFNGSCSDGEAHVVLTEEKASIAMNVTSLVGLGNSSFPTEVTLKFGSCKFNFSVYGIPLNFFNVTMSSFTQTFDIGKPLLISLTHNESWFGLQTPTPFRMLNCSPVFSNGEAGGFEINTEFSLSSPIPDASFIIVRSFLKKEITKEGLTMYLIVSALCLLLFILGIFVGVVILCCYMRITWSKKKQEFKKVLVLQAEVSKNRARNETAGISRKEKELNDRKEKLGLAVSSGSGEEKSEEKDFETTNLNTNVTVLKKKEDNVQTAKSNFDHTPAQTYESVEQCDTVEGKESRIDKQN